MSDVIEIALAVVVVSAAFFVFKGDPSLYDLWHANAVAAMKGECVKTTERGE